MKIERVQRDPVIARSFSPPDVFGYSHTRSPCVLLRWPHGALTPVVWARLWSDPRRLAGSPARSSTPVAVPAATPLADWQNPESHQTLRRGPVHSKVQALGRRAARPHCAHESSSRHPTPRVASHVHLCSPLTLRLTSTSATCDQAASDISPNPSAKRQGSPPIREPVDRQAAPRSSMAPWSCARHRSTHQPCPTYVQPPGWSKDRAIQTHTTSRGEPAVTSTAAR